MAKFEKDETHALIRAAQSGDDKARSQLVAENMGLVLSVAKKFYNRGYDREDINQLGAMGLLKSINNFRLSEDVKFSTYAVPVIMGEIKRFLRDDGPLKVSRTIKQTASQIAHFAESEQKSKGKSPGVEEIAQALEITVEEVVDAMEATRTPESIFATVTGSDVCIADILRDELRENSILTSIDIKNAVDSLDKREQTIVKMRYFMEKTQSEVAKKTGISQVQVSRLEKKILEKLRISLACEN